MQFSLNLIIKGIVILTTISIISSNSESIKIFNLSSSNENSLIKVKEGQIFKVKIQGNPTTGYQWMLIKDNLKTMRNIIVSSDKELTGEYESSYINKSNEPMMVGSGGYFYFTLKAVNIGAADIKFEYKRSWEQDNIDELTAHIIVEDNDLNVEKLSFITTDDSDRSKYNLSYYNICMVYFIFFAALTWFI